jgi:multidrug efflux pump subunit AcrA (membrane-fusion protein)
MGMRKNRAARIITGIIGLTVFFNTGIFIANSYGQARRSMQMEKVVVRVMPVQRGDLDFVLFYVGNLKAKAETNVFSKAGGKLIEYMVNEGDQVSKGQTIALVDRDETGLQYQPVKVQSPLDGIAAKLFLDKGTLVLAGSTMSSGTSLAVVLIWMR